MRAIVAVLFALAGCGRVAETGPIDSASDSVADVVDDGALSDTEPVDTGVRKDGCPTALPTHGTPCSTPDKACLFGDFCFGGDSHIPKRTCALVDGSYVWTAGEGGICSAFRDERGCPYGGISTNTKCDVVGLICRYCRLEIPFKAVCRSAGDAGNYLEVDGNDCPK